MPRPATRLAFVDALKAFASQFIVLHHLAFYGPMSDAAYETAPSLFSWLAQDARIAVQVFLVIGGYLAARGLAAGGVLTHTQPWSLLKKRYLKLAVPFLAAILVSILFSAIARQLMVDDAIPDRPTFRQLLAHIALLHGVLGFDSLSAGAWYIAIDFQLFALMLGVLWLARGVASTHARAVGIVLVSLLAVASLYYFNLDADWDNWALYFFGAYALGALTYWFVEREIVPDGLLLIAIIVIAALLIDFRSRILVALMTALSLGIAQRWGFLEKRPQVAVLAWLGKISYSVFLIHFPLILVINGLFDRFAPDDEWAGLVGIGIAWGASIAAGALFYRSVESRSGYWQALFFGPVAKLGQHLFPRPGSSSNVGR